MAATVQLNRSHSMGGKSFGEARTVTGKAFTIIEQDTVPVAQPGTLAVRTDNDTGTLTMTNGGHGITTGARLDLYWTEGGVLGCRRGIVVGTVSGTSVPIDLGSGDNLPSAAVAIIAAVPVEVACNLVGNNVRAMVAYAGARAQFVFADASNVELHYVNMQIAALADDWDAERGTTNPFAGDSLAKVFLSHADTAATKEMRVGLVYN